MTKQIIAKHRTQVPVGNYVVVDMRQCAFTDGLPEGALLISQRPDGTLYADRLLSSGLCGIDGDEAAVAAWKQGVEIIMGAESEQWLKKEARGNYNVFKKNEYELWRIADADYQLTCKAAANRGGYG